MGLNFTYKKGYSYKSDSILEQSSGALTPSDIKFLQYLGYKVLSSDVSTAKKIKPSCRKKAKASTTKCCPKKQLSKRRN